MDPFAISSVQEDVAENVCELNVSEIPNEETYCSDQLNISGNKCDCAGYFEMPESVMDTYLMALDGGDESNAALRQISDVFGPKEDGAESVDAVEKNTNCNHNPEFNQQNAYGCSNNYVACDCESGSPYEGGVKDKKREGVCENNDYDTYLKGLRKPVSIHGSSRMAFMKRDEAYQRPQETGYNAELERNSRRGYSNNNSNNVNYNSNNVNNNNIEMVGSQSHQNSPSLKLSSVSTPVHCSGRSPQHSRAVLLAKPSLTDNHSEQLGQSNQRVCGHRF